MVSEANAMSDELDKKVKFEICLISPQSRGLKEGSTEVLKSICTVFSVSVSFVCDFELG